MGQQELINALRKLGGEARRVELEKEMGRGKNTNYALLRRLMKQGVIIRSGYGKYKLKPPWDSRIL